MKQPRDDQFRRARKPALVVVGVFVLLGVFWVFLSGRLVEVLGKDHLISRWLIPYEDWMFVGLMAAFLYVVAHRLYLFVYRNEFLQRNVDFDALTGLPNRVLFTTLAEHAIHHGRVTNGRIAVLKIHVRGISWLNESLGVENGDEALRLVSERLRGVLRPDDVLGRVRTNVFGVLMEEPVSADRVAAVAESALEVVEAPIDFGGTEARLSANIGISFFPEDGDKVHQIMSSAESALSHALRLGLRQLKFYTASLSEMAYERFKMEGAFRHAVAAESLELAYQPQIDLKSGRIIACEALLRWKDPTFGKVSPAVFVPMAEENGLILPIGRWVLKAACEAAAAWQWLRPGARIAVNVSSLQIESGALVDDVRSALERADLDPSLLEVEVTETVAMSDPDKTLAVLSELRELGVTIAIDDFGTGYSSMSYLRKFPIDRLKIDRAFVQNLPDDASNYTICQTTIGLARSLGMIALAEGIEHEAEARSLLEMGCQEGQGFLYYKPMPDDRLREILESDQPASGFGGEPLPEET